MEIPKIVINVASVKVMRSYDYCHFEVTLSTSEATTPEHVDELRKTAARLADKAVRQYKVAKADASRRTADVYNFPSLAKSAAEIEKVADDDRTPEQKAELKAYQDACFRNNHSFDYQDDWQDEGDDCQSF